MNGVVGGAEKGVPDGGGGGLVAMVALTKCPCVGSLRATISLSRREKCLGLPLDDGLPIT